MKKIFIFIGIFIFSFFFLIGASNTNCNNTSTCSFSSVECSDNLCAQNGCFFNCSNIMSCLDCLNCPTCNNCTNNCENHGKVIENVTGIYDISKSHTTIGDIMVTVRLRLDFPEGINYKSIHIDYKLTGHGETQEGTANMDDVKGGQTYSFTSYYYFDSDVETSSLAFEYVVRGIEEKSM